MIMNEEERKLLASLFDVCDVIGRHITHAKSRAYPLLIGGAVIGKLVEAQQAVFAAQRLLEADAMRRGLANAFEQN